MTSEFKQLFQNKNFVRLWFSQIASQVTISMVNFALITRIFEATGSSVAVSFIWITYGLPALIIGPIVGPLIDLTSKRHIMILTNLLQAIAIGSYLLVKDKLFPLYTIIFIYSFMYQFYSPTEAASIPTLVRRDQLSLANSLYLLTFQVSVLFGFALSGPLLVLFGHESPYLIGVLLLILAAISLSGLPKMEPNRKPRSFDFYWRDLTYGYRYIRNHPLIYLPILFIMAFQTGISIVSAIFPSFVREVLSLAVRDASWVLVIPGGMGALFSAVYILPRLRSRLRKSQIIEIGLAIGTISLVVIGGVVPLLPPPLKSIFASFVAFTSGIAGILLIVPANTLIQEQTPPSLRGRVFGSLTFLLTIAMVAPTLMAATISDVVGAQTMALVLSGFTLIVLLVSKFKGDELLKTVTLPQSNNRT
jgi:MFS family permease